MLSKIYYLRCSVIIIHTMISWKPRSSPDYAFLLAGSGAHLVSWPSVVSSDRTRHFSMYSVCVFSCTVWFVSINQVIGCENRLQNDLGLYMVASGALNSTPTPTLTF